MPTPFTHLDAACRWLHDDALPADLRRCLAAHDGAYLLGSIAADCQMLNRMRREDTHFYAYDRPLTDHPWRVMLNTFPALAQPDEAQRAFVTGYVGHLAMDEVWWLEMMRPHFGEREWAARPRRFFLLHIILSHMDERDEPSARLSAERLRLAEPSGWLPFIDDATLRGWRDLIYGQIKAGGSSQTLPIISGRIGVPVAELRAFLDAPAQMAELWTPIPPLLLAEVEAKMYRQGIEQMSAYWQLSGS
jgi:hypothetical protein